MMQFTELKLLTSDNVPVILKIIKGAKRGKAASEKRIASAHAGAEKERWI